MSVAGRLAQIRRSHVFGVDKRSGRGAVPFQQLVQVGIARVWEELGRRKAGLQPADPGVSDSRGQRNLAISTAPFRPVGVGIAPPLLLLLVPIGGPRQRGRGLLLRIVLVDPALIQRLLKGPGSHLGILQTPSKARREHSG